MRNGEHEIQVSRQGILRRGYYVDTAGKDAKKIKGNIQRQLKEYEQSGQLMIEDVDPFTGSKK